MDDVAQCNTITPETHPATSVNNPIKEHMILQIPFFALQIINQSTPYNNLRTGSTHPTFRMTTQEALFTEY